uniref:Uncharacterized protein n=1 Tax=Oryza nivara TaxID=4536 RepID=A0A679BE84_ORYNI|nr:hypothetical protein [Oryza sativa f. spontanea]
MTPWKVIAYSMEYVPVLLYIATQTAYVHALALVGWDGRVGGAWPVCYWQATLLTYTDGNTAPVLTTVHSRSFTSSVSAEQDTWMDHIYSRCPAP